MKLKNGLISLLLVLLSSCGGQNSPVASNGNTTKTASAELDATARKSTSAKVSLMDSLTKLYPNGQLPANRATQAAKDLAQNPAALSLTAPAPTSTNNIQSQKAGIKMQSMALAADFLPVARIQNTTLEGSYFFSIYDAEIENALTSNPDWILEGAAFWASIASGDGLNPVHRFRNLLNGSYLYTIYDNEKASIVRDYSRTFAYEGVAWHARQTQAEGWTPLYRFRNLTNGTYLFTAYEDEKDLIQIWFSDIFALEGVAYYVRLDEPPPDPVVNVIAPLAATIGIPTVFVVQGTNLPLDSKLSFVNASCSAPVQSSATGFSQTCIPTGPVGVNNVSVKAASASTTLGTKQVTLITATPSVEPRYTGKLTDTGTTNTQCYGAGSNAMISCTSAAAITLNPKQDGMIGRDVTLPAAADGALGFSYSSVPKTTGGVFDITECVKDNTTGLTWEGIPVSGSRSDLRTGFTNYDSVSKPQKPDLTNPSQSDIDALTNTVGYQNYVNSIALCGYTDWRMPAIDELHGIVNTNTKFFDSTWFPNANQRGFWSSTNDFSFYSKSTHAWYIDTTDGLITSWARKNYEYGDVMSVILVRGPIPTSPSRYSYINNGAEVADSKTGLIWKRCEEGAAWNGFTCIGQAYDYAHEQALIHAATQSGWRLPNRKELASILDLGRSFPAIDPIAFPNASGKELLTSTPFLNNTGDIWIVHFDSGHVAIRPRESNGFYKLQMRLVRNST